MNDAAPDPVVSSPLLGPDDPPPFTVVNPDGQSPVVLVCDHASNAIPAALGQLGLGPADLSQHIAWDIGAAGIARLLAARLDAPAVLAGYSRLVIDCNRAPGDPTSIAEVSDGILIPGNRNLDDSAAEARLNEVFWPYHHAITRMMAHRWRHGHGHAPALDLCVGDNEPYSGREVGFTMDTHGGAAGLPHVEVEIRQDLIADEEGVERWAMVVGDVLAAALVDQSLYRMIHY